MLGRRQIAGDLASLLPKAVPDILVGKPHLVLRYYEVGDISRLYRRFLRVELDVLINGLRAVSSAARGKKRSTVGHEMIMPGFS